MHKSKEYSIFSRRALWSRKLDDINFVINSIAHVVSNECSYNLPYPYSSFEIIIDQFNFLPHHPLPHGRSDLSTLLKTTRCRIFVIFQHSVEDTYLHKCCNSLNRSILITYDFVSSLFTFKENSIRRSWQQQKIRVIFANLKYRRNSVRLNSSNFYTSVSFSLFRLRCCRYVSRSYICSHRLYPSPHLFYALPLSHVDVTFF